MTGCGADWRHVFTDPPSGYRVIAPDLRGHGASSDPAGDFTFRRCASDVRGLLGHLGLTQVKAIALSGGGLVALHLATAYPETLKSMVLVSAPPYFPEQVRALQRRFTQDTVGAAEMERLRRVHCHGESQIEQLFAITRRLAEDYDDVSFTPPSLARITADTLVVFGDRDPLYPVSLAFELNAAIARSYLWVVPNGGHGPVFGENAASFVRTALAFLRGDWNQS
jgi:pimeloyl-ACP methyl ester carboxylesterase